MVDEFSGVESVHYETTDPGRDWVKDPFIAVDLESPTDPMKSCTPNVIRLPGGGFRMYYTEFGPGRPMAETDCYIKSAISEDCVSWRKEGLRLYMHPPYATKSALCPDVIPLPDGRYRMYYEGRRGTLKKCVNSQAVYPLCEQNGLEAQERRYTAHEEGKH